MLQRHALRIGLAVLAVAQAACGGGVGPDASSAEPVAWALAIHGGAGTLSVAQAADREQAYRAGLEQALRAGSEVLEGGGTGLDAVERVLRLLEDDPKFNAGRGAVFNHDGGHELDASIMDGASLRCGAVAGVTTVKNPISLARLVMESTPHVLLAGAGAERFADETGVERVSPEYFYTETRWRALQRALEREAQATGSGQHGTVGAVALDRHGNLAAGTSTGGLTNKRFGRVGDSPIVGAGTYADNRTCAVSGTGKGEEFIRHAVAHSVSALVEHGGRTLAEAVDHVLRERLRPGDGGIIAVSADGALVLDFNTEGMFRGAADSRGRFEVGIGR